MSEHGADGILVEQAWLAARLGDADLRIVDCDGGVAYRRAHIPGAVYSESHPYKSAENHRIVTGPQAFAAAVSAIGVGPQTEVVAYDSNGAVSAGRLWWCLTYYGHERVRVLDGGWPRWLAEGRPITMTESKPAPAVFTPKVNDSLLATADYVKAAIGDPDVVILDTRSSGEWEGTDARGNPRAGRIPGSVHLEYKACMLPGSPEAFRDAAELRRLFEAAGVTPDKEIVTYCQGGGRAAQAAMTLRMMGFERVRNYDGSFGEWSRMDGAPIER